MHSISHQLHSKMSFWGAGGCCKEIIGSDCAKRHKHHNRIQRYDESYQCNTLSTAPNRPTNVYIWIMEKIRIYKFSIFFLKLLYALTLYRLYMHNHKTKRTRNGNPFHWAPMPLPPLTFRRYIGSTRIIQPTNESTQIGVGVFWMQATHDGWQRRTGINLPLTLEAHSRMQWTKTKRRKCETLAERIQNE